MWKAFISKRLRHYSPIKFNIGGKIKFAQVLRYHTMKKLGQWRQIPKHPSPRHCCQWEKQTEVACRTGEGNRLDYITGTENISPILARLRILRTSDMIGTIPRTQHLTLNTGLQISKNNQGSKEEISPLGTSSVRMRRTSFQVPLSTVALQARVYPFLSSAVDGFHCRDHWLPLSLGKDSDIYCTKPS